MKTNEVVRLFNEVMALQGIKKTVWEFNRMLIAVKRAIKEAVENYRENLAAIQEEIVELKVEFCQKDEQGKAVIARRYSRDEDEKLTITEEQYVGLVRGEQPEFDERFKRLNDAVKELGNKKVETDGLFNNVIAVKRSQLPKEQWDGNREEIFFDFIKENISGNESETTE